MLSRLDSQQESLIARAADDVVSSVTRINDQLAAVQRAREAREEQQAELATLINGAEESPAFSELVPQLPEKFRPAVEALVRENNELLVRVQQRVRQNHLLLSRSLELMQQLIQALVPNVQPLTYHSTGAVASVETIAPSFLSAVG